MKTKMETMSKTDLIEAARQYDNANNEGGEGYNPYRAEIERRDADQPHTRTRDDVLHDLEIADNSIARETGTYDQAKVDALKAELAEMDAAADASFLAEWTPEVTEARKAAWNRESKARNIRTMRGAIELGNELGFSLADLKRASKMYK